ncbi:MAG: hypothetical protein ACYC2R_15960 [Burkholderiales bacterium]
MKTPLLAALSRTLNRHASRRAVAWLLLCFAGFFWLFNFSTLPVSNPSLQALSGGEGLLDLRIFYTADGAYRAMGRYGAAGRELYRHFLMLDMLCLASYGLGFSLLFSRLIPAVASGRWQYLNLLPLGIALADSVENTALFVLLQAYPGRPAGLGTLAGLATLCKHAFSAASLLTLGAASCLWLWRRYAKLTLH